MNKREWRAIQLVLKGNRIDSHCFGTRPESLNGGIDKSEMALDNGAIALAIEKGWLLKTSDLIVKYQWPGGSELESLGILKDGYLTSFGEAVSKLTEIGNEINGLRVALVKDNLTADAAFYRVRNSRLMAINEICEILGQTHRESLEEGLKEAKPGHSFEDHHATLKKNKDFLDKYFDIVKRHFIRQAQGTNLHRVIAFADKQSHKDQIEFWEELNEASVEVFDYQQTGLLRPDHKIAEWLEGNRQLIRTDSDGYVIPAGMKLRPAVLLTLFNLLDDYGMYLFSTDRGDLPYIIEDFADMSQKKAEQPGGTTSINIQTFNGILNNGTIKDIQQINVHIQTLKQTEPALAQSFEELTNVVANAELPTEIKDEAIERIEELSEEAAKPASERKPRRLKERLAGLTDTLKSTSLAVGAAKEVYHQLEPVLNKIVEQIGPMISS